MYRAIDTEGHTLDIWLRKKRDSHSAYAFIKRLIKQFGTPQMIITDQAPSTKVAMAKIMKVFKLVLIVIAHLNISITSLNKIIVILS